MPRIRRISLVGDGSCFGFLVTSSGVLWRFYFLLYFSIQIHVEPDMVTSVEAVRTSVHIQSGERNETGGKFSVLQRKPLLRFRVGAFGGGGAGGIDRHALRPSW